MNNEEKTPENIKENKTNEPEKATENQEKISEKTEAETPVEPEAEAPAEIQTAAETVEPTESIPEQAKKPERKSSGKSPAGKAVRIIIFAACLAIFAFSGYKIVGEFIDNATADNLADEIRGSVHGDEEDDGSDDVNVPAAPAEHSGTTVVIPNNESKSEDEKEPDENNEYDDRTYEEEEEEEENTQYYVSRPSQDKDAVQTGLEIRPEEISLSEIKYLKSSNLKNLLKTNSDTVGWIYFPGSKSEAKGTPIDTAIVQTTDNEYYLSHTFDKKENINGWIYADYRCNMKSITSNYNTIIYGHARSYTMFGGLKDLNTAVEWYSNGYNHFIKINTLYDETVWQVFSWYETNIYYDYIKTSFSNATDFIRFAYEVQDKNQMTGAFETFEFDENDRILTLSTCKGFDTTVRVAVHAKLVKRNPIG